MELIEDIQSEGTKGGKEKKKYGDLSGKVKGR